jgi:hypothetical protein
MSALLSSWWKRLRSWGMMTPLERASSDLADTERKLYQARLDAEQHDAYIKMHEKRKARLQAMIETLNTQKDLSNA